MESNRVEYPQAARIDKQLSITPQHTINDPYYWLRDDSRSDPAVQQYIAAENNWTAQQLNSPRMQHYHSQVLQEFERIEHGSDMSRGTWRLGLWLYTWTEDGITRSEPSGAEWQLTGVNPCTVLTSRDAVMFEISPDHRWLAWGTDQHGNEDYTVHVRDINQGCDLPREINHVGSMEAFQAMRWSRDSNYLLYTSHVTGLHATRCYCCHVTDPHADDVLMYEEQDDRFVLSLESSTDQQYLFLVAHSSSANEIRFTAAHVPKEFTLLQPRADHVMYFIDHHKGYFYIGCNRAAENFQIWRVAVEHASDFQKWQLVLPHHNDIYLLNLDAFDSQIVVYEQHSNCTKQIRVVDIDPARDESGITLTANYHYVPFSERVYSFAPGNIDDNYTWVYRDKSHQSALSHVLFISYTSLTTPKSLYAYHFTERTLTLVRQQHVIGYDARQYCAERLFVPSLDDTCQVPISLVYRKDKRGSEPAPMVMSGYGAYGASKEPRFSLYRLSLLDRGIIYAIPHVRGGTERGRHWHLGGKAAHKQHSIGDLIACARALIERGYTTAEQLAIRGRSAGGLLVTAAAVWHPELFRAVIAEVPFVDVLVSMADKSVPWRDYEVDEWGDATRPEDFAFMSRYCPIYNLTAGRAYPNFLVTTGMNDPRVQYWEPVKLIAKLRHVVPPERQRDILLKTFEGGHFDRDRALFTAFILHSILK